jgi:hypothetical protein
MRPNFSPSDPVLLPHLRIGVLFISGDVHFGEIARLIVVLNIHCMILPQVVLPNPSRILFQQYFSLL